MHDFAPVMPVAHFAEDPHSIARSKRFLMTRIEREEAQHELRSRTARRTVVFDQTDELATWTKLHVAPNDDTFGLRRIARAQLGKRSQMRMVFITQRQMQD